MIDLASTGHAGLLTGKSVLVVEDEMLVLMTMEDMLADLGCESVAVAATVGQALALIDGQAFDLAILDVNLNGQVSYPVAAALEARGVPFAFATGYSDHATRQGHHDQLVLCKPYREQDLVAVLAQLLRH